MSERHGTSQNGEDLVLNCLTAMLPGVRRFAVEIGADVQGGHVECNTIHLTSRGWVVVLIDEDPLPYLESRRLFVTAENLADILADCLVPPHFGVLSIDVDGVDYWLWDALPAFYRPSIVVIEYNAEVTGGGKPLAVVYDPAFRFDETCYFGANAEAMVKLAHRKGYKLVTDVRHVNLFFVAEELLPERFVEPDVKLLAGRIVGPSRGDPKSRPWVSV